jgi:malate dehydrogenase (oxaloacetate-decarboxylating)(NADP+)
MHYAHEHPITPYFNSAVESLRPTAIIGVSAKPDGFSKSSLEAMARINERPIIFALSNPTCNAECTAEQAYTWTKGKAVFASGSPFDPCTVDLKTYETSQSNNAYIFPGVGMGVAASGASHVTDEMFFVAAKTLAGEVSHEDLNRGCIYPDLTRIRDISALIAAAVAEVAFKKNIATQPMPSCDLLEYIKSQMYEPEYQNYV